MAPEGVSDQNLAPIIEPVVTHLDISQPYVMHMDVWHPYISHLDIFQPDVWVRFEMCWCEMSGFEVSSCVHPSCETCGGKTPRSDMSRCKTSVCEISRFELSGSYMSRRKTSGFSDSWIRNDKAQTSGSETSWCSNESFLSLFTILLFALRSVISTQKCKAYFVLYFALMIKVKCKSFTVELPRAKCNKI